MRSRQCTATRVYASSIHEDHAVYCLPAAAGVSSGRGGSSGMIPSFTSSFSSSPLWCTRVSARSDHLGRGPTRVHDIGSTDKLSLDVDLRDRRPVTAGQRQLTRWLGHFGSCPADPSIARSGLDEAMGDQSRRAQQGKEHGIDADDTYLYSLMPDRSSSSAKQLKDLICDLSTPCLLAQSGETWPAANGHRKGVVACRGCNRLTFTSRIWQTAREKPHCGASGEPFMNTTRVFCLTAWSQLRSDCNYSTLRECVMAIQRPACRQLTSSINCLASVEIALDLRRAALNCVRGTARCCQMRPFRYVQTCTARLRRTKDFNPARANMSIGGCMMSKEQQRRNNPPQSSSSRFHRRRCRRPPGSRRSDPNGSNADL